MGQIPVINVVATGQNITQMRIRAGMTVQELQQVFGFSTPQAIYKWQKGVSMPTLDNIIVLAAVFGTTVDDIIVRDIRQFASA